jgi:hypothetical protein
MTKRSRSVRMLAVAGATVLLGLVTAGPAAAHPGDPTLVNSLREAELPDGVTAAMRTTIGDELVVTNSTPTPLVALDADGAEFLRISAAGVEGNSASPYFHLSTAPPEVHVVVPRDAVAGAPARWVPLSAEPSWSWFDPRLSPQYLQVPVGGRQEVSGREEVATWSVPLRYGDEAIALDGALERRPVTGRFETTVDPAPAGLTAVIAPGYVPVLSVQAAPGRVVTVMGRDGRPYLRFGPAGAQVDRGSPTFREDLLGRGRPLSAADTGWLTLPGSSSTWLDTRLRYPAEDPPAEFATAERPVEVARWEIPVVVDGTPQLLTGAIRWLPNGHGAAGSPWIVVALIGGAALLVAGGATLVLRTRRLAAASAPESGGVPEHEPQPTT